MKPFFLHLFLLLFMLVVGMSIFLTQHLEAQDSTSLTRSPLQRSSPQNTPSIGHIIERDIAHALSDGGQYITAPLRFTAVDWAISAGVVGGTIALFPADEALRRAVRAPQVQTPLASSFAAVGRFYGETLTGGSIGALIYATGLAAGNEDVRVTGRLVLEALVYGGALNLTMKSAFGRSRPYTEDGAMTFRPIQFNTERTSFPSGHATVAFAVSSVLSERIGNPAVSVGLYALAGLTALSRMYNDVHWASDVLLGAAIGTGAGLAVTYFERERVKKSVEAQSLHIYPTLNGVGLTYVFR